MLDAREWLGLEATHNPLRWVLPVTPAIATGHGFLFGGCGLGAAIVAMERATERPVVWATAQYLSYANIPSVVDLDVTVAVAGRNTAQARAVGRVGDQEIFTVNAALGQRKFPMEGTWAVMPEVPSPEECGPRPMRFPGVESVMDRLDLRMANARAWEDLDGTPAEGGRSALWARLPDVLDLSSGATLAILGDYVPFGIGQALGVQGGGNSLDNTLRVYDLVATEWVLLDIQIHGIANGFGHGEVHLWSRDGTLLATASQSTIVRLVKD